ncbi:hypothetical protein [uncultured Roseibium sp.]|uniref:hypothetical protein n=1 Tax=uncultured Roseibium sp. TaxID=1936171 RepID=UPI002628CE97|nr:hypothetical protein [uncultured Roseibium sp.]
MVMTALERCKYFGVSNIQGMAYHPGPSNYKKGTPYDSIYHRSDFYNNIFTQLWSEEGNDETGVQGRGDLKRFKDQLGVNFIHCYDWSEPIIQRDQHGKDLKFLVHKPFFDACHDLGMKVTIPISNHIMRLMASGDMAEAHELIRAILGEVGQRPPHPAAGMIKIFNEYELVEHPKPEHVAQVISWILEWEGNLEDKFCLPIMVCTSFGMKDDIEGAGYMKDVFLAMKRSSGLNPIAEKVWRTRMVFATNPQREGSAIEDYLENRLPAYWEKNNIPVPPVMFTELGSSIEQTGSEEKQAEWMTEQIKASRPGSSGGNMLGACIFLNEERVWETGPELTFGITRFGPDTTWGRPDKNGEAKTVFPVWDNGGWFWGKEGTYPVEQQVPKLNYKSVANAWRRSGKE